SRPVMSGGQLNPTLTSAVVAINAGCLAGIGTVGANVVNAGPLPPGTSPGTLSITRTYTQTSSGALNIELSGLTAGSQYDRLAVTGAASLAGALDVTTPGGLLPHLGAALPAPPLPS